MERNPKAGTTILVVYLTSVGASSSNAQKTTCFLRYRAPTASAPPPLSSLNTSDTNRSCVSHSAFSCRKRWRRLRVPHATPAGRRCRGCCKRWEWTSRQDSVLSGFRWEGAVNGTGGRSATTARAGNTKSMFGSFLSEGGRSMMHAEGERRDSSISVERNGEMWASCGAFDILNLFTPVYVFTCDLVRESCVVDKRNVLVCLFLRLLFPFCSISALPCSLFPFVSQAYDAERDRRCGSCDCTRGQDHARRFDEPVVQRGSKPVRIWIICFGEHKAASIPKVKMSGIYTVRDQSM